MRYVFTPAQVVRLSQPKQTGIQARTMDTVSPISSSVNRSSESIVKEKPSVYGPTLTEPEPAIRVGPDTTTPAK